MDILSDLDCRNNANNNFKNILEEIAHKNLGTKPIFIIDCFVKELKDSSHEKHIYYYFISIDLFETLNNMKPSS
jgi:hypothetical protein